ncbi:MAG: multidrug effflux MFS transporter [Novosphingobium sp.]|nr:multidrug effflux MFS transporter [Novosphingobium sp.]
MNADTGESRQFPMNEVEFVLMMASLMALQALAIDVMLPALSDMAAELGVANPNERQLVIGVFLLSSGAFALFSGPLADRFGRKPLVLACLVGYLVTALLSTFANSFPAMLAFRVLQGVFSSGLMTLPAAILRDRFEGDRMAKTQSMIAMVFMAVPMLAPLMGQGIMALFGWRAIFGAMALLPALVVLWVWFRLPETLHPDYRQSIELDTIARNMLLTLTLREAMGYVLGGALVQAVILGYINSSQQLIGEALGAGEWFPTIFGAMAAGMSVASFVNSRIVERFGARRVSQTAMFVFIGIASIHLAIIESGNETLWSFAGLMMISMCMVSFMGGNFMSIAMQPFARIAGSAASAMAALRLVGGAGLGVIIGQAFDGTPSPLIVSQIALGAGVLLLILYSERGRLFRRLNPPKQT